MISGFELAGLVGTLDASINVTTRIVTILRDFKNFDDDEISIADSFQRLSFALKNFQKALKTLAEDPRSGDADMREDLAALVTGQSPRLAALQSRLSEKVATMEKWKKGGNLTSRGVWAVWRKREMEKLQRDLAEWVNHFHLAYISIEAAENTQTPRHNNSNDTLIFGRILNLFRDEKFQSALPLDRSHLPWAKDDVKVIQETTAFALVEVKDKKQAIAEFVPYSKNLNNAEIEKLAKQLENTAQALCQADPQQTRILTCIGYYHDTDSCRLGLLYEIPIGYRTLVENEKPVLRTLHDIWGNKPPTHSLDQRVRLTRDISTAILYIHAVGWVHKDRLGYLPQAFLLGLHSARGDLATSYLTSDEDWKASIYRHPSRQRSVNNARFRMSFDIYSVGVIMLELALWGLPHFRRFVDMPEVFEKLTPALRGAAVMELVKGSTENNRRLGRGIHCELGRMYRGIVEYCLARGVLDGDGSLEFVEEVWTKLNGLANAL